MADHRPNVLFVFGDQWRASALGYAGNPDVKTPHLDALASQSINFPRAVAGSPVCCVYRASMLTGQYPHQHGVFLNDGELSPEAYTFGEHFSAAGYDTAYVGKWHVDGHGREAFIPRDRQHRFDYWRVLECTHNYNNSKYYADDDPAPRTWEGYDAFAQTRDLIGYLRRRESDNPFCAFLSWGPPHNPYHTAPDKYRAMYDKAGITLPPNVPEGSEDWAGQMLAGYYAHCTALDDCMAELLAALETLELADHTILVFTSDHGDMLGSHAMCEKCGPWDEALRVPLLIRWPSGLGTAGRTNHTIWNMVDFFPTLSALAGLEGPASAAGRDLSVHLRAGTTPQPNDALYASYFIFGTWYGQNQKIDPLYRCREARGIRTVRHTYIEDLTGPWLLYDNDTDPDQVDNLVGKVDHADAQRQLAARLREVLAERNDAFEPGQAYLDRFYPGVELGVNFERRGQ